MAKKFDLSILFKVIDKATSPIRQVGKALKGLAPPVTQIKQSLGRFAKDPSWQNLKRQVGNIRRVMGVWSKDAQRDFREVSASLKALGNRMNATGKKMRDIGKSVSMRLTLPIVAFGGMSIKAAKDFQASMNMVGAVIKTTGERFKQLEDLAKDLGRTTQFSASEAADGMKFLGMAGLKAEQIMIALPKTLELAASAQMGLAEASDIVTNIMSGYGKKAEDLGKVNDVLVNTFIGSNVNLQQLGESFKYAGAVAKGAGFSFKDTAAFLGMLGSAGIQGSMAGTSLKNVIAALEDPTKKEAEAMENLGIKFDDLYETFKEGGRTKKKLQPLMSILEKFRDVGLTSGEAMKIFGLRGGPALAALLGQGKTSLEGLRKALDEEGTASRIALAQMKGLPGAFKSFTSAFEAFRLAVVKSGLGKWVESVLDTFTKLFRRLAKADPKVLKWGTIILGIVAAVGPLLVVVGFLSTALGGLAAMAGALGITLGAAGITVGMIVVALISVAAAVYQVVKHWETLKGAAEDFSKTTVGKIASALWHMSKLIGAIGEALLTLSLEPLKEWLDGLVVKVKDAIQSLLNFLPDFIKVRVGLDVEEPKMPGTEIITRSVEEEIISRRRFGGEGSVGKGARPEVVARTAEGIIKRSGGGETPEIVTRYGVSSAQKVITARKGIETPLARSETEVRIKLEAEQGTQATVREVRRKKGDAKVRVSSAGYVGGTFVTVPGG